MKKLIAIVLLIGAILAYVLLFNMRASSIPSVDKIEYSKDDFVEASTLSNENKLVATNSSFDLYINETNSYFKVVDKATGTEWLSNPKVKDPWETDPTKPITNTAIEKQKATLEITYFNETGATTTITNYKSSIYHPGSVLSPEGQRTFAIKYVPNGFQVKYQIKDLELDYLYFPKYVDKTFMESLEDSEYLQKLAYKKYDEVLDAYYIEGYEDLSRLTLNRLYAVFYDKLEYTREQSIQENFDYGYFDFSVKPELEVAIQVLLTPEGIKTSIIHDSIVESDVSKISNIVLYPLFGTALAKPEPEDDEDVSDFQGYIVLPDGNGAVIQFDNGKQYQNPYRKRLYGQDLALLPYKLAEEQQKITIPLYGMVKENGGFAAIITDGDAMANIHADVSGRIDSYNKVYTSFNLREYDRVILGSGFNQYGVNLWTKNIVETDFSVEYFFLSNAQNTYVGIAKKYREYLIKKGMEQKDNTPYAVLNTEFIGAYDKKEFFLGVPYYTTLSMTTFNEAKQIIDQLFDHNINHLTVSYLGMMNGGLSSSLQDRAKIERAIGGKNGLKAFEDYLNQKEIDLYAQVDFITSSSYHKLFDSYRYTAQRIDGSLAYSFSYHYPSRLPYSETEFTHSASDYVINPVYYEAIYRAFDKRYDGDYLSLGYLGSSLAGHYTKKTSLYRQDSLRLQEQVLSEINQQMMMESPLGFALPYADVIVNLPTEATLYSIIDDQIPLLQLVLSGLVDYSSQSLNTSNTRSIEYNFLKILETGSNVKYTLSFDDSRELLTTEYNYFMSTKYDNWIDTIIAQMNEIDDLGIHEGYLVNHERMQHNVYRISYSHGLVLLINYNLSPVTIGTTPIPAMDYVVIGG